MSRTALAGLAAGLVLGFALAFGGGEALVLVLVFGALGLFVGKVLDGDIDVSGIMGDRDSRR